MNQCVAVCPHETVAQDARSVGIIDDDEIILRASYAPMHLKKGKVHHSFVRAAHLFNGKLSVWRSSGRSGVSIADAFAIADDVGPDGHSVHQLHGPTARQIRDLRNADGKRLFCIVDETSTDDGDGAHPAHAHIRICDSQRSLMADTNDAGFRLAREQLIFVMSQPAAIFRRA